MSELYKKRSICLDFRSSPHEFSSVKEVLKICRKFTGEHPCRIVISIKLQNEATLLKSQFDVGVLP